jgi:hypothetical protein
MQTELYCGGYVCLDIHMLRSRELLTMSGFWWKVIRQLSVEATTKLALFKLLPLATTTDGSTNICRNIITVTFNEVISQNETCSINLKCNMMQQNRSTVIKIKRQPNLAPRKTCEQKSSVMQYFDLPTPSIFFNRLRGLPSRLWPKCNRLLRLGRLWGAVGDDEVDGDTWI